MLPIRSAEVKKRGRTRKSQPTVTNSPNKESPNIPGPIGEIPKHNKDAAALWKFLERTIQTSKSSQLSRLTLDEFSDSVYRNFQFENTREARNYTYYQSEYLLKHMQERRRNKEWSNSPIYNELLESDISTAMKGKMAQISLRTRERSLIQDLTREAVEYTSSSEEETTPRHRTKSSLRPKAGKKSKSYRGNGPLAEKRRELDEQDSPDRPLKRRTLSRDVPEQSSEGESSSDTMESSEPFDLQWKKGSSVSMTAQLDIDPSPNSDGDVWRCPSFGCVEAIHSASSNLGRSLVQDHIERHKKEEPGDHLDIVMREMKKCNLPVKYVHRKFDEELHS